MHNYEIKRYLTRQIGGPASFDLVISMFDFTLAACIEEDTDKALKGLTVLEQTLNFQAHAEVAHAFCSIYRYCRYLVSNDRSEEACGHLRVLRDAWGEAKAKRDRIG
jgi:flagellin-specific chaperone FliS